MSQTSGLKPIKNSALIVIDAQQSFTQTPYFSGLELDSYLLAQNQLIATAITQGIAVVRIFHVAETGPFALHSGLVKPLEGLADFEASATFYKTRHSALVGSGLDVWLVSRGINQLVISGIRTEQCCETTARHSSDLGFVVDFALDATLTFAMQNGAGVTVSPAQIKAHTALVLQDRFAQVRTAAAVAAAWQNAE